MLRLLGKVMRVLSLVLLAALGSAVLMRYAPGYFSDARELDAAHANGVRAQLSDLQQTQASVPSLLRAQIAGWAHGDLGQSRHFEVPVALLLRQRAGATARLLGRGIGGGWLLAVAMALPLSARRTGRGEVVVTGLTAVLLAVPVGVLATMSLLTGTGGPVLVLALLIAVRDFKLLYRMLRSAWQAPHLLYGRAQGLSALRMVRVHLVPVLGKELVALAMMSVVVALSSLVPVEVIFDVPGLGQLAWTAAMNRDLPLLVAVTGLLAGCVGVAGLFAPAEQAMEVAQCA